MFKKKTLRFGVRTGSRWCHRTGTPSSPAPGTFTNRGNGDEFSVGVGETGDGRRVSRLLGRRGEMETNTIHLTTRSEDAIDRKSTPSSPARGTFKQEGKTGSLIHNFISSREMRRDIRALTARNHPDGRFYPMR